MVRMALFRIAWAACLVFTTLPHVAAAGDEGGFTRTDWPFNTPRKPELPVVLGTAAQVQPVDAFVLEALQLRGLSLSPRADKPALLRRVTFDLTGLPPTPEELAAFLADASPRAYEKVVDRLLSSTAFGERAAQFWLDLVRYAETDGFKADGHRPHAWRYRDYVITSANTDLPYDQFVAQQLAGDELAPDNPQALVATGYCRLYPDEYNAANLEQRRQEILDDVTEVTGLAFLGLTFGCARCHDHKYDEILQTDYYSLQSFFAALYAPDTATCATPAQREAHDRQASEWEVQTSAVRAEMESLIAGHREALRAEALTKFRGEIRRCVQIPTGQRSPYEQQIAAMAMRQAIERDSQAVERLTDDQKKRYEELSEQLAAFDGLRPSTLPLVMAATDVGPQAPPTFVLAGGNWREPLDEVAPRFPDFLGSFDTQIEPGSPSSVAADGTTGRRSALARWLGRSDHPLTSRVAVNRIWQQHFGVGIVASPNDFGIQGEPPTHPELLDWLATELVEHGWSLKHIHRLLVTSDAYCQTSLVDTRRVEHMAGLREDPENRLLWHARRRRLEGEALRDALLAVSGDLNRRSLGPSARPALPEGISKSYAWTPDENPVDQQRRSIFVFAKRNLRMPIFEAFDQPDLHHSCARRMATTTAPQALMLLNSEFALSRAAALADRLLGAAGGDQAQLIKLAYVAAYGRRASSAEVAIAQHFLAGQSALLLDGAVDSVDEVRRGTVVDFCHALLISNEFLYVD
jgi:hypothetical protein